MCMYLTGPWNMKNLLLGRKLSIQCVAKTEKKIFFPDVLCIQ